MTILRTQTRLEHLWLCEADRGISGIKLKALWRMQRSGFQLLSQTQVGVVADPDLLPCWLLHLFLRGPHSQTSISPVCPRVSTWNTSDGRCPGGILTRSCSECEGTAGSWTLSPEVGPSSVGTKLIACICYLYFRSPPRVHDDEGWKIIWPVN